MPRSDSENHTGGAAETASQVARLVSRSREGDKAAFEQLVDMFHKDVFRMVYYRTRSRMDAEDITQEIFMNAFNNLMNLRNVERFRPWIFSIGLNKIRDFNRKKRIRSLFSPAGSTDIAGSSRTEKNRMPDADEMLMKQEFWQHVDGLLDKLSRMEREVFLLRFLDHLTIKEISQVLKKSESAVKTHLYRSIKKFRNDAGLLNFLNEDMS